MTLLQSRNSSIAAPATGAAMFISALALAPIGFILWVTFQTGWQTASALLFRPRIAELLINTTLLELVAVPLAILLGVALAWLTERTDLPGARLWSWLAVTPLAIPAFVHSYGWASVAPHWSGLSAATAISVLAYFPFLYLPVAAQLRRLDPAVEEAAASLGQTPWQIFFRVVLPQLRFAICGGSLLIGLHLLAEYGLYVTVRFDTFTTAIMDQFQSSYSGPAANMIAIVLALYCIGLLFLERTVRGSERYARIGTGAARMPAALRLGRARWLCLLVPVATIVLALGVPLLTLARWLVLGGSAIWQPAVGAAFLQTMLLALIGGILATVASMPMAWLSVRAPGRFAHILEGCHYYVGSLPGIVVALALVALAVHAFLPLYQTLATLLMAYLLLFLPRALIGLRSSVAQTPVELEQAATMLGRSPLRAVMATTLRLAAPGAAAAMALVGLGIATELTATLMLAPTGVETLATAFWSFSSELDYARAAPYAFLMVILSLPLTILLQAQSRWMAGR
jgi:iron(III) transport system permease protein